MGHGAAMRRTRVGETSGPAMALPCLARTPKPPSVRQARSPQAGGFSLRRFANYPDQRFTVAEWDTGDPAASAFEGIMSTNSFPCHSFQLRR